MRRKYYKINPNKELIIKVFLSKNSKNPPKHISIERKESFRGKKELFIKNKRIKNKFKNSENIKNKFKIRKNMGNNSLFKDLFVIYLYDWNYIGNIKDFYMPYGFMENPKIKI